MPVTTDRILTQRDLSCMVAVDNIDHIGQRIRNLLSHNRRITVTERYTYVNDPPKVTVGLTVDDIRVWSNERGGGIGVHLKPGLLAGFGVSAHAGENDTEAAEWKRFHAAEAVSGDWVKRRRDMTRIDITGGLDGDGPARDDLIVIRHWNRDGVCDERVVAFDDGPRDGEYRAARWLYGMALGPAHMEDRLREWDHGKAPDADVELWASRAKDLLAAVADERN